MNLYGVIALLMLLMVIGFAFDLAPAITRFVDRLLDIPKFTHTSRNPALYELAIRMIYLITLVAIVKLVLNRKRDDDDT